MKKILLNVTGSISAYKNADLTNQFVESGVRVDVIMSRSSTRLITPLTLQSLSERAVHTDVVQESNPQAINRTKLAKQADSFLIAPITADIIDKLTSGIAGGLLSTIVMALSAGTPKLIALAMNTNMYRSPITQRNLETLRPAGYQEVEPEESLLACGGFGEGALADIQMIIEQVMLTLNERNV